jgi:hypothetical protein
MHVIWPPFFVISMNLLILHSSLLRCILLFYGHQWIRDFLHEIKQVFSSTSPFKAAPMLQPAKGNGRLFHDQIILYGCDPFDAPCDLTCFIDGILRINEAAQLNNALEGFDTDLE